MTEEDQVLFEEIPCESGKKIGRITLNAPKALNSLALDMIQRTHQQLLDWEDDDAIACVWLEGAGEKAFCAGGDIVEMYNSMTPLGERNSFTEEYFASEYRLDYLIHVYEKPVIVWGHGVVMGGGMGLMQGANHRIVTEKSKLAMPEITIGLYPDVGGSWFLNRTPGKTGLFAGLTGVHLNAGDALFMGLADVYVHADRKADILAGLQALSLTAHERTDDILIHRLLREEAPAEQPGSPVHEHLAVINRIGDHASLDEVVQAMDHHKDDDDFLHRAVSNFERGSAQTAWLVWEQLVRARYASLAECFRMEWCISTQCAMHADFREGVRALLIDKDGQPRFRFRHVYEVPEGYIDNFFVSPASDNPLDDL
jgi:enoyl-CoA hydratase/carnithine racemase